MRKLIPQVGEGGTVPADEGQAVRFCIFCECEKGNLTLRERRYWLNWRRSVWFGLVLPAGGSVCQYSDWNGGVGMGQSTYSSHLDSHCDFNMSGMKMQSWLTRSSYSCRTFLCRAVVFSLANRNLGFSWLVYFDFKYITYPTISSTLFFCAPSVLVHYTECFILTNLNGLIGVTSWSFMLTFSNEKQMDRSLIFPRCLYFGFSCPVSI